VRVGQRWDAALSGAVRPAGGPASRDGKPLEVKLRLKDLI